MGGFLAWLRRLFGGGSSKPSHFIGIDPGHGGRFPGAVVRDPINAAMQIAEKDVNLEIALKLDEALRQRGHRVFMTRIEDIDFADEINADLVRRARLANDRGVEVYISVHCNSADNPNASGFEMLHFPGSSRGTRLAEEINAQFASHFPDHLNRGVKSGNFVVLRETRMPGCIVESDFLSNRQGLEFLLNFSNQREIARAIADALEAFLA